MLSGIADEFQLTRSRGARRTAPLCIARAKNFNSRAHVERDTLDKTGFKRGSNFNSRAHVERDSGTL